MGSEKTRGIILRVVDLSQRVSNRSHLKASEACRFCRFEAEKCRNAFAQSIPEAPPTEQQLAAKASFWETTGVSTPAMSMARLTDDPTENFESAELAP